MDTAIENLIPHRAPFLFADTIISYTKEEIVAVKTFSDIRNIRVGLKLIKRSGGAYVREEKILEASWMCITLD